MTNQRKLKTGDRITTRIMVRRWTFAVFAAAFSTGLMATVRGQTPGDVQPEDPKPILMRMAGFMATNNFSVDVSDSYDVVQESGHKIEFNEKRKITVARPDRLHIAVEESDGEQSVLLFDGKVITMSTPSQNVYAQTPKPGTLDDAIIFFVHDLGMRIPFAPLLISTAPAELARRTKTLEYVEETSIFGKPAHHLAGRTTSARSRAICFTLICLLNAA